MGRNKISPEERLRALLFDDASPEELAKLDAAAEEAKFKQTEHEKALEAEAVLLFFDLKGAGFIRQKCPECDKIFAYKYTIACISTRQVKKDKTEIDVTYKKYTGSFRCSNECRRASLAKIGIEWTPRVEPEERWRMNGQTNGTIPIIVPPAALTVVESALQASDENNSSPVV
jgi:hypothetical protein